MNAQLPSKRVDADSLILKVRRAALADAAADVLLHPQHTAMGGYLTGCSGWLRCLMRRMFHVTQCTGCPPACEA